MITKATTDFSECDFSSGEVLLIDKPSGWSSFKVVRNVRKAAGVKKVGHAGTLDPMATGLLILCTGKKTKEISGFMNLKKTYTGVITLGKSTPSMDLETDITEERSFEGITEARINEIKEKFTGKILQVPPMYSAIKKDGKPLYKLARKGKVVEREPREIEIYSFIINRIELPEIYFEITCSKGTYIRVIANDFGNLLGSGGVLSALRRTGIGFYSVGDALEVDDFVRRATLKSPELFNL